MTFWEQAGRGRYKGSPVTPITEKDARWSTPQLGPSPSPPPESDPLYGPKTGFRYQAHLLYLAWQEGNLSATGFQNKLRKLCAKHHKTFSFGGGT